MPVLGAGRKRSTAVPRVQDQDRFNICTKHSWLFHREEAENVARCAASMPNEKAVVYCKATVRSADQHRPSAAVPYTVFGTPAFGKAVAATLLQHTVLSRNRVLLNSLHFLHLQNVCPIRPGSASCRKHSAALICLRRLRERSRPSFPSSSGQSEATLNVD